MTISLRSLIAVSCVFAAALSAGCATTASKPQFAQKPAADQTLRATDVADIQLIKADKVAMLDTEKERLLQQVQTAVKEKQASVQTAGDARNLRVDVVITRYQKGNAFARAMLAGLGQMHIDGKVAVYRTPENDRLADFKVSKTFAWGGIYGASTRIEERSPRTKSGGYR